jgi:hypothetical protein
MDRSLTAGQPEVRTVESRSLQRLQWLGNLLDNSIALPGTRFRFGLDSLIGLVPGIGDLVGGALSVYIVLEAARLGVPRALLVRMGYNVAVDALAGSVPVLGDLFDAGYKANLRNLELVQAHVRLPGASRKANRRFTAVLVLGLVLLLAAAVAGAVLLVELLRRPVL